ncbi:efflux transporter outer membrane subunit [Undibacterium pigrum]|uniref:NodT family efflux transporter outer membrane factor (OMF) lipoprotein n=1 Tax=Undibacterium pigrum TaxID=401470 RepID=A0A318JKC1_9BURK|nr:efflux transporter outer membrane subunit [Undibacterium pigrum]PXX47582.1 NodT family efflux transporter outer membrane factor (OMF) lipoprotein [Undibacterium pigrum]
MTIRRFLLIPAMATLLAACATTNPPASSSASLPAQWQAILPAAEKNTELRNWWQTNGDASLLELIEAAQKVSPTLSQAWSRMETARAARVAAGAALLPSLDGVANATRAKNQPGMPVATTAQAGLQTSWELDLFGGNRANNQAAQATLEGSQALWHDARISVAAEVAQLYFSALSCQQVADLSWQDAKSRAETARVTELSAQAGMSATATSALARASAAEGNSRAIQQAALCDLDIKALVALTAKPEAELRQLLNSAQASFKNLLPLAVSTLPAQLLTQRPDVFAAEKDVAAASSQVGAAEAQRYPRLSLSGSIGTMRYSAGGSDTRMDTWSVGPLALTLPIFNGGQTTANIEAAKARYLTASSNYHGKVRQAVREVEEALVNLNSTDARRLDSEISARGYDQALQATALRYNRGMASLLELEDARRTAFASQSALITLQLDRNRAWIALYRALGGGWDLSAQAASQSKTNS